MIDFQENTLQLVTVLFLLSSAREGRREDIQDMLMEEEENRRKLLKKKSVAKRARFSWEEPQNDGKTTTWTKNCCYLVLPLNDPCVSK